MAALKIAAEAEVEKPRTMPTFEQLQADEEDAVKAKQQLEIIRKAGVRSDLPKELNRRIEKLLKDDGNK